MKDLIFSNCCLVTYLILLVLVLTAVVGRYTNPANRKNIDKKISEIVNSKLGSYGTVKVNSDWLGDEYLNQLSAYKKFGVVATYKKGSYQVSWQKIK
jgi:hypothetical protein